MPDGVDAPARLSLLSDQGFRRYWAGQAISAFGDAFAFVAFPLLVLDATGSVAAMGGVSAAAAVAQLLTGVVAGPIVDRRDRRRLMIACDLARVVLCCLVPLVWHFHGPSLPIIYIVMVLGSALGNLFSVAYVTATPDLVDRERLTEANGRLQGSQALAFVIGPMLGGILAASVGSAWAIGIDALTFAASAVSLAAIRLRREGRATVAPGSVFEGVRFLAREPQLRAVTIIFILLALLNSGTMAAGILDVLIYHLRHVQGSGDRTVGMSLGLGAIGAVLGALSAPWLRVRFGFGACFVGTTFLQAIALFCMGSVGTTASGIVPMAIAAATWTAGMTVRGVVTQTLRQELTPAPLLGRVTAAFWTLAAVLAPIGAAAVTLVAERWSTSVAFRATGVGSFVVSLLAAALILPASRRAA